MTQIKSGAAVSSFLESIKGLDTDSEILNPEVVLKIEENYAIFERMGRTEEGCLDKLAFISAVLRTHNIENLNISISFDGTYLKNIGEIFVFNLSAEHYKNMKMPHRDSSIERFSYLKEKYIKDSSSMSGVEGFRINSISKQLKEISKLFEAVKDKLAENEDSAIALTSYLLFEAEAMSQYQVKNLLMFYDLFDLNDKEDRWFACIDIEANYQEIKFKVNNS